MNISAVEIEVPYAVGVKITEDALTVDLSDGSAQMSDDRTIQLSKNLEDYLSALKIPSNGYWGGDVRKAKEYALSLLKEQGLAPCLSHLATHVNMKLADYDEDFNSALKAEKESAFSYHYEDYREEAMYDVKDNLKRVLQEMKRKIEYFSLQVAGATEPRQG